ncbi:MAG TPA: ABC transporter substrate-binding protein [Deltaproteobacteria bacterium]|nr:ABC transporter substrate-binding protein [Deltaproteobacteria bacterium]HPR55235.1 ABC transporter substrate-binding protein [Deltaproteobacteria bacterium]HXK46872.1 ABC transporter substrate-binding protein [Deltaproteobacteria bacterium]
MSRKNALRNVIAFIVCAGFLFCGSHLMAAGDPIKIGFSGPFTGSLAFNGGEMKKGAQLAVDQINSKGGLFGRKVEVVWGDDEAKPEVGVAVVKKMITRDDVLVVGGGYNSSVMIAVSDVCSQEKTPLVVAVAITPTLTERGLDYVYRTSPNSPQFLMGACQWLEKERKPKTVAFLMENTDYGRDGEKIYSALAKKIGAKELAHLYFEIGDTDFTTQLSKLKNLNPEITFCIGSTTEQALIQKQSKELGYVSQWLGAGGHFTEAFFNMLGTTSAYCMGVSLEPTLAMKDPVVADFVKQYEAKYNGARPGIFSGQAYDNVMVILDAIKRAGNPTGKLAADRDSINKALKSTSIKLTQGTIKFDKTGQVVTVFPYVVQTQIVNGKPELNIIYPPEKATGTYQKPLPWNQRKF